MNIASMNIRITIQKNTLVTDEIGNHLNEWTDFYSCFASVFTKSMSESDAAGDIRIDETVEFNIRYSSEVKEISSTGFRIIFNGNPYNITSVDYMGFKNKTVKIYAERERDLESDD